MTVRFGIVGLGKISNRFTRALNTVDGVELTAVAARDPERAKAFAQEYQAKKASASYLDLIKDEDVDVVYIGLTHNFHYEIARLCLEHHKGVICEKPLVTSRKDAEALAVLAEKNHTLLMEALWTRCMPCFQKARQWAISGRIGEVKLVSANFCRNTEYNPTSRLFDPNLAGGCLFDLGVYPIGVALGILNEHPTTVTGAVQLAPNGSDLSASMAFGFKSGALASLNCSFSFDTESKAVIYGTEGRIVLDNCYGPKKASLIDAQGGLSEECSDPVQDGFIHQIQHCADLYQAGSIESPLIPWKDSIACASIFDELRSQWGMV